MRRFFLIGLFAPVTIIGQFSLAGEAAPGGTPAEIMNAEISAVSRLPEKSLTSAAPVNVVTREMIRAFGYRTLYDVLQYTPGFWSIQDVNDKILGVRGVHASTNQKFLLLINGKRVTENLWNLTDVDYNISLSNVKQIEIVRGPNSISYGRSALTAVINVVTLSGEELDGGDVHVALGNYGYRNLGFNYGTKTARGSRIEVFAHAVTIDGQELDVSSAQDGARQAVNGQEIIDKFKFPTGGLITHFSNRRWDLSLILQSRVYQQPRGADGQLVWQDVKNNDYWSSIYADRLFGEQHNYIVFDADRHFSTGDVDHTLTVNYTYSRLRMFENPNPLRDLTIPAEWGQAERLEYSLGELFDLNVEAYRAGLEYFGTYDWKDAKLLWGAEAYRTVPIQDRFTANFTSVIVDNQLIKIPTEGGLFREKPDGLFDALRTEHLYSAYAEIKKPLCDNLWADLGLRYDLHVKGDDYRQSAENHRYPDPAAEEKRSGVEKRSSQLSPRVAVIYQPFRDERLTLKSIYNKSFTAPGYFYRYADPSTSYAGGPWLKAETLDSYMLTAETVRKDFGAKLLYFLNINRNLLTRDLSLVPARYTSLGKLGMQGAEMDLYYRKNIIDVFANVSYLLAVKEFTDELSETTWIMADNSIKNFPKLYGSFGISGRFLENRLVSGISALWHMGIQSPIAAGANQGSIEEIGAALRLDWSIRYQLGRAKATELGLSVFNLLDQNTRLGGTVRIPYSQAGRWIVVSLSRQL